MKNSQIIIWALAIAFVAFVAYIAYQVWQSLQTAAQTVENLPTVIGASMAAMFSSATGGTISPATIIQTAQASPSILALAANTLTGGLADPSGPGGVSESQAGYNALNN
jgi:hypothetical protein